MKLPTKSVEKNVERYLVDIVKKYNGVAYKFVSPGLRGVPDRIVVMPDNQIVFAEIKDTLAELSAIQLVQAKRLRYMGAKVFVLRSREDVDQLIFWLTASEETRAVSL